nr:PAS domain-containing protein [Desulfosarcina cetonica]
MTMWLIRDGDGQPMEMEGTIEDITARKEAELALQRSEAMHRLAQRIAGLGHWEVAPIAGKPIWSDEMYHIYEWKRDAFDGSLDRFLQRVHPDDRDDVVAQITDAREKGAPIDNVHRIVLPDRRVKYIYSMGHVEYGDDGEPIRIVGTSQDVTQQKLAEMQKEESEQRLLQAQKLEAIGTLAGGIAHDFNNILTSIIGFTQRAAHLLPENSPAIKKLDIVLQAGMRARDLVDHILAFSRESKPECKPVQTRIIVKEAIKLLRATIPANIAIKPDIASQCGRVLADPVQIHQVVMNLCTNAYHAIGAIGGQITVSLAPADLGPDDLQTGFDVRPGAYAHLRVADTGRGMDQKTLGKIFDPYFTTKREGRERGWGCPWFTASSRNMAARYPFTANRAGEPPLISFCLVLTITMSRKPWPRRCLSPAVASTSWWSTTKT